MKLIIQIPCLNESATLHRVVSDLPESIPGIDTIEVLVIDDGSEDNTAATALGLGVHHVIRHRCNRGLAAAFSTGLETALALGADVIVNTDGDHQYPGTAVPALVSPILNGEADLVIGDRNPHADQRNGWIKRTLYVVGRVVVSWMLGQRIPDPVSGFRAYSRLAAARTHVTTKFSYTLETLVQAVDHGTAIRHVPITTNPPTRPSRLFCNHMQFVLRSATTLLRAFFMYHPLQTMLWMGGLCVAIGSFPILRFLVFFTLGQGDGHLQSLILGSALLIAAVLMIVVGLLSELVAQNRRLLEKQLERSRYEQAPNEKVTAKPEMRNSN